MDWLDFFLWTWVIASRSPQSRWGGDVRAQVGLSAFRSCDVTSHVTVTRHTGQSFLLRVLEGFPHPVPLWNSLLGRAGEPLVCLYQLYLVLIVYICFGTPFLDVQSATSLPAQHLLKVALTVGTGSL